MSRELICKPFNAQGSWVRAPFTSEDKMTLQEYEAQGGCEGCFFYCTIDVDGRKGCTFDWFDDESDDWNWAKRGSSERLENR